MALVGNISGSGGTYSTVGITGSVIFAYTDTPSAFPSLTDIGPDVVFFVSGSTTGKDGPTRNVAVFGGDTVVSGSLTIGSGSVKLTSNDIQFSAFGTRIERSGNNLKFFDANNAGGLTLSALNSGGGGGGTNFFLDTAGAGKIYTTASTIAFPMGEAGVDEAADKGTGVVFYVSGSAAAGATALFGGNMVTSGTFAVKNGVGANAVILSTAGTVSGSGTFSVGGDLLVQGSIKATDGTTAITLATSTGNVTLAGDLAVNGATSADITTTTATATLFNTNATTVTIAGGATTSTTVGNATGGVTLNGNATVAGDLAVNGATSADITTTTATATLFNTTATTVTIAGGATTSTTIGNATGGVTLNGTATVTGDLAVNGATSADITTTTSAATIFNTTATSLNIGGQATAVSIGASGGTVTIPGNLTVQGATTTIDTTNLLVEDPIIYFGSGSTTSNQPGGIALASGSSVTHQALVWGRVANDTWGAGRLDVENGTVTNFTSLTNYLPVRASKFEVGANLDGNSLPRAFVSASLGNDLILSGTNSVTVGSTIINFQRADSTYATLNGTGPGTGTVFAAASGRSLTVGTVGQTFSLSGSIVATNFASSVAFQKDGVGVVSLTAPTTTSPTLVGAATNSAFTVGTSGGTTDKLVLSGTLIESNATSGFKFLKDGTAIANISSPGANQVSLVAETASTTANVFTSNATTVNIAAGGSTARTVSLATGAAVQTVTIGSTNSTSALTLEAGSTGFDVNSTGPITIDSSGGTIGIGTDAVAQAINVGIGSAARTITVGNGTGATSIVLNAGTGNIDIGANAVARTTNIATGAAAQAVTIGSTSTTSALDLKAGSGNITSHAHVLPNANNTLDLGSPSARWRNMYTGDLHLKNERGNWTIIEEREYLSITNNITGKRYKFVLQEIE